jgi:hypothetical protein
MTTKVYKTIFEEEADGVRITLALEEGLEEKNEKAFNLNFALMELASQLVVTAKGGKS